MSIKTIGSLESAVSDVYQWLNEIEDELNMEDRPLALQMLRAVLHALRDRLTIEQSAHLSVQLPLLVRGLYFENWKPQVTPDRDRTLAQFYDRVRTSLGPDAGLELRVGVDAVVRVLERHLSWGEDEKISRELPREIAALWNRNAP